MNHGTEKFPSNEAKLQHERTYCMYVGIYLPPPTVHPTSKHLRVDERARSG